MMIAKNHLTEQKKNGSLFKKRRNYEVFYVFYFISI